MAITLGIVSVLTNLTNPFSLRLLLQLMEVFLAAISCWREQLLFNFVLAEVFRNSIFKMMDHFFIFV